MVDELMESVESIIACGCVGVVVRMAHAAAGIEAVQKPFVAQIMKTFHVNEPPQRKDGMSIFGFCTRVSASLVALGSPAEGGR